MTNCKLLLCMGIFISIFAASAINLIAYRSVGAIIAGTSSEDKNIHVLLYTSQKVLIQLVAILVRPIIFQDSMPSRNLITTAP